MANFETYTTDQIKKMQSYLKKLPVKDTSKTKKEVIELLEDDIKEALDKGYTLKDICDVLNKNNIKITYATLKAYIQRKKLKVKTEIDVKVRPAVVTPDTNTFVKKDLDIDEL